MALTLKDWGLKYGYDIGYDPNKGVTITNPKNNQSINFKSGQGSSYGITNNVDASVHYVSDPNKLTTYLSPSQNVPTAMDLLGNGAPAITPYEKKTGQPQSTMPNDYKSTVTAGQTIGSGVSSGNTGNVTPQQSNTLDITSYRYGNNTFGNMVDVAKEAAKRGVSFNKNNEGSWILNGKSLFGYGIDGIRNDDAGNVYLTEDDASRVFNVPTQGQQQAQTQQQGATEQPNRLKDVASQLGYSVNFDQGSGTVIIINPQTGKAVSFKNGEGQEYGMGGIINDYNVVSDINKLQSALSDGGQQAYKEDNIPQQIDLMKEAQNEFGLDSAKLEVPDYSKQINELLTGLKDYNKNASAVRDEMLATLRNTFGNPFQYDPNTDPALQSAMKYAENQVMEQMNARGILNSTITGDEMRTAYAEMVPKYQELAFQKYNENIKNQLQYADFLQKIDSNDYQRYSDFVTNSLDVIKTNSINDLTVAKTNIESMWNRVEDLQKAEDRKLTAKSNAVTKAIERLKTFGYVLTNEDAIALGVPVGTPSDAVLARAETHQNNIDMELFKNKLKYEELAQNHAYALDKIVYEIKKKGEESEKVSQAKSSVANVKAQLLQLTPEEALVVLGAQSQNILNSDIAKYAGEEFNTMVGDIQKYVDDAKKYKLDVNKYNLQEWQAMEQSNRGWAANKISQGNLDERIKERELKQEENKTDKNYVSGVKSHVKNIISDFKGEMKNVGILENNKSQYLDKELSAERKQLFDKVTGYLSETDMLGDDVVKTLNENGFTKNEISKWLKKK
jgi:hypothetical protein